MAFLLKRSDTDRESFRSRLWIMVLLFTAMLSILIVRLVNLQIVEHSRYTTLAQNNRISLRPEPPTRGLIFDRNMQVLAENRPTFWVEVIPEQLNEDIEELLARLEPKLALSDWERRLFLKRFQQARRFERVPLRVNVSEAEISAFAVDQFLFPGLETRASLIRHYPEAEAFAHPLGYVGRINEKESKQLDPEHYQGTHFVGKTGIEAQYEAALLGAVGHRQVESNAYGRIVRELDKFPATPGQDVILTLDSTLQKQAHKLMQGKRGAFVALNPQNGEILAIHSAPSFDPNLFVSGMNDKTYKTLQNPKTRPLFDRALKGQYPPASTLKPFVALAALESDVIDTKETLFDPGWYRLEEDSRTYKDWKATGHGWMDLNSAIAQSCDTYFYEVSHRLGIEKLALWLRQFGFGEKSGIDLPGEASGLVPTTAWKRRVKGEPWYPGETLISGIGQGFLLATPIQLASAVGMLANHGQRTKPHLLKALRDENNTLYHQVPHYPAPQLTYHPEHWEAVMQGMRAVIDAPKGTAHRLKASLKYPLAGKTGTAQVFGLKEGERYDKDAIEAHLRDHSLFIGVAPVDNPEIAIAIVIENERGSTDIAKKLVDSYLLPKLASQKTP